MRISARCNYACQALLCLTMHWPNQEPLPIQAIAEKEGIPHPYLVQILNQLKSLGLVHSLRGREGGYALALPPSQIKLGQVLREIGGPLLPLASKGELDSSIFTQIWDDVEQAMATILDRITFEIIRTRAEQTQRVMLYQI